MPCENFVGGKYPLCEAVQGLMAPSLAHMAGYCTSDDPSRFPLAQQYAATHTKVPLDAAVVLTEAAARESERRAPLWKSTPDVEGQRTIAVRATQRARRSR